MPYFGGKRQAAAQVWKHLGDPYVYIEPFAGSLGILLGRPNPNPGWEIVCDLDGLIINFWRAIKFDAQGVLDRDMGPVSEVDIEAWHHRLLRERDVLTKQMETDYLYYDLDLAHMWWAGMSSWIGAGWCDGKASRQRPHIDRTLKGLYSQGMTDEKVLALSERLANCIVLSGNWPDAWERGVSDSIIKRYQSKASGKIGVFLDPPYTKDTGRANLYTEDAPLSQQVEEWALKTAKRNGVRIVVAGYSTEYPGLLASGWTTEHWKRPSGYVNNSGNKRRHEDVLFLSPLQTD